MENNRTIRNHNELYFTLKLRYEDKTKNLESFALEWNLRHPKKSKEAVLHHNKDDIVELIKQGESTKLEFKSSARWNLKENKLDKTMEEVILKTVAAFLNSEGGTLLIGVADDGKVLGLQHDYKIHRKQPNRDGYEQFLTQLLLRENFGLDLSSHVKFSFHTIEREEICQVKISPSPRPVYLTHKNKQGQSEEQFWIRSGNSNQQLTISKFYDYCKHRFG
jgi:predicted HTH transcriptional regulator